MRIAIVHYHLAPGGVTKVIESTSRALTGAGIDHAILTEDEIPALGYLSTPGDFTAVDLVTSLHHAANLALGAPPDLWHFHNHSLGKNCLIAEAVALLAESGARIVLHIHDLAENGRPQNYQVIAGNRALYPFGQRIRYVFLNSRDREIFTTAGLPPQNASLLPNPIEQADQRHADGPPILFAPVRGIRRKNLGELVLFAALAPPEVRVAVSRAPTNPDARPVHDTWRNFARKHHLPITFDVVGNHAPAAGAAATFESWIEHATHFVTTSVSEGFGLPFLESVAHGKPLIGRDLPHLTAEHGIRCGRLYQRILIPIDWVDATVLRSHLTMTLERNHRLYQRPLLNSAIAAAFDELITDGQLDFGNLPEPLQQGVIERLAETANREVPLVQFSDASTRPLEAWLAEVISERKPTATPDQLESFSPANYGAKLIAIYQNLIKQETGHVRPLSPQAILNAHFAPGAFHFLCSAPEPITPPPRFRAVVFDIYGTLLIAPSGGVKPDPAADPLLREIIESFGYIPPESPSTALHSAVLRHHATAAVPYPEIDLRTLWREVLLIEPGTDLTPLVEATEAVWHPARPMPGAAGFIQALSRSGISLGLLSNAQCNTLTSLGAIADLFPPELVLLSYQHKIAKPDPVLFQMLADRLAGRKISPAETLYIGNDPLHDIAPAAAAGFRTALFTGHPDSLRPGDCAPDHVFTDWREFREFVI